MVHPVHTSIYRYMPSIYPYAKITIDIINHKIFNNSIYNNNNNN